MQLMIIKLIDSGRTGSPWCQTPTNTRYNDCEEVRNERTRRKRWCFSNKINPVKLCSSYQPNSLSKNPIELKSIAKSLLKHQRDVISKSKYWDKETIRKVTSVCGSALSLIITLTPAVSKTGHFWSDFDSI